MCTFECTYWRALCQVAFKAHDQRYFFFVTRVLPRNVPSWGSSPFFKPGWNPGSRKNEDGRSHKNKTSPGRIPVKWRKFHRINPWNEEKEITAHIDLSTVSIDLESYESREFKEYSFPHVLSLRRNDRL